MAAIVQNIRRGYVNRPPQSIIPLPGPTGINTGTVLMDLNMLIDDDNDNDNDDSYDNYDNYDNDNNDDDGCI